jgi:hypothetical protein
MPEFWKFAVNVHGPASGFVRMNNQFCLPAGTFGSLVVVPVQNPLVVPLPVQKTVIAMATPTSNTRAARIVTTTAPVFVKRRRKRCMTDLPLPPCGDSSDRASFGRHGISASRALHGPTHAGLALAEQWPTNRSYFLPLGPLPDAERVHSTVLSVRPNPFDPPRGAGTSRPAHA